jgi:hypothetical protein
MWFSVLQCLAVLWADSEFSEEKFASIFRVEVCGIWNRLNYINTFQGAMSFRPMEWYKK